MDDRLLAKKRKCLKCGRMFASRNAANRVCPGCTSRNAAIRETPSIAVDPRVVRWIELERP